METIHIEIESFSAPQTLGMIAKGVLWYAIGFAGIPALFILIGALA